MNHNLEDEKGSVEPTQNYFECMAELVKWLFLQSKHTKFVHAVKAAQLKTSTVQGWIREGKTPNIEHFERWMRACGKTWHWYGKIQKGENFDQSTGMVPPANGRSVRSRKTNEADPEVEGSEVAVECLP